jgi:hypothetical protein
MASPSAKGGICTRKNAEPVFVNLLRSPSNRFPAWRRRFLGNRFPGFLNVYKYGLCVTVYMTLKWSEYSVCNLHYLHLNELKCTKVLKGHAEDALAENSERSRLKSFVYVRFPAGLQEEMRICSTQSHKQTKLGSAGLIRLPAVPEWSWCRNADAGLRQLTNSKNADALLTFSTVFIHSFIDLWFFYIIYQV